MTILNDLYNKYGEIAILTLYEGKGDIRYVQNILSDIPLEISKNYLDRFISIHKAFMLKNNNYMSVTTIIQQAVILTKEINK